MRTWFPCWLQGTIKSNQERLIGHGGKRPLYPLAWNLVLASKKHVLCHDFPFLYERIDGSLKTWQNCGWFCMRFHFFIEASFMALRAGTCHERGNISFSSLFFCFRSADFLSVGLSTCWCSGTSARVPAQKLMVLCSHFEYPICDLHFALSGATLKHTHILYWFNARNHKNKNTELTPWKAS